MSDKKLVVQVQHRTRKGRDCRIVLWVDGDNVGTDFCLTLISGMWFTKDSAKKIGRRLAASLNAKYQFTDFTKG